MIRWTRKAHEDLQAQLAFIERDNPLVVKNIAIQIRNAVESLESFPQLGREGRIEGTQELIIPKLPFICVYRDVEGQVEILRLLHERMQWPR